MRIFVAGATGYVGSAVVRELLDAGHQVVGLARSDASAAALTRAGVDVHRGDIGDLGSLRAGAAMADGVIYAANQRISEITDQAARAQAELHAAEAIGLELEGTDKPFAVTSGVIGRAPGRLLTEQTPDEPNAITALRLPVEQSVIAMGGRGVRSSSVRLAPIVHGPGTRGFISTLIGVARATGVSAFVGDGSNRWPAVHRLDAATLFRLAGRWRRLGPVSLSSGSSVFTVVAAPEPGARRRDESVWRWLERSSEPMAAAARARWDRWLSRMPPGPRTSLIRRLQDRDDEQVRAALAELVTFALLDPVYPAIEVDPGTGSGSRTDFAVDVPVRTHFEVHRPAMPRESAMDARRLGDIATELEKIESPDFWLDVDPQSGAQVPSMRQVRRQAEVWLASLDYGSEVQRRDEYQQARRERAAEPMPGLDAGPAERAAYFTDRRPFEPAAFTRSGDGWSVRITAHPRPADQRGPASSPSASAPPARRTWRPSRACRRRSAASSGSTPAWLTRW